MALDVVDPRKGERSGKRNGLGKRKPNQKRPCQAGPPGYRDPLDGVERYPGIVQGLARHRRNHLQVPPGGYFRNHPAIFCMDGDLGGYDGREDAATVPHHGCSGFITGCFNGEDQHDMTPFAGSGPGIHSENGIRCRTLFIRSPADGRSPLPS
jgi:hypothetical protein